VNATGRLDLARKRRAAHAGWIRHELTAAYARHFRAEGPRLRKLFSGRVSPPLAAMLGAYEERTRRAVGELDITNREQILPALLHLSAVRLIGIDREAEVCAYAFWERTLQSLARHRLT
jgi:hypothetical protein